MEQNEDDLDDRELPDESDMDPEGDEEGDDTEPCPFCGKAVYVGSEWCPYCGKARVKSRKPLWVALIAVVCAIAMLVYYMF